MSHTLNRPKIGSSGRVFWVWHLAPELYESR
jgi:hypothetical protein